MSFHSDVWVRSPVFTKDDYQYFVNFIYDYSHVLVFLLKSRLSQFDAFQTFYEEMKSQFGIVFVNSSY